MDIHNHGSIDLMLVHGGDMLVVNAARVSFGNEDWFRQIAAAGEEKLIHYLAKNRHVSPFYHPVLTFRVKLPISLHRQWEKHKIGTCANSQSTRYSQMPDQMYVPDVYRQQSKSNKQGSNGALQAPAWGLETGGQSVAPYFVFEKPEGEFANMWFECTANDALRRLTIEHRERTFHLYNKMVALGVAKEQARGILPLDTYTAMVWTASLAAVWHFISLRDAPDAQGEIQEYAQAVRELAEPHFPISFEAFKKYGTSRASTPEHI